MFYFWLVFGLVTVAATKFWLAFWQWYRFKHWPESARAD